MPSERRAGHATLDNGAVPESSGTPHPVIEENEFAELLKACDNPPLKTLPQVGYRQGLCKVLAV